MDNIKIEKDSVLARKNDKVKYWYLVQEGTVYQKFGFTKVPLEKNAIIGILEKDIYLCDYVAGTDAVLTQFSCENAEDLKRILTGQEKIRNIFLRAAIGQRHAQLVLYTDLYNKSRQFHMFVETVYNDYKNLCVKYKVEEKMFSKMEHFNPLVMQHRAEIWEVDNSKSLVNQYMQEYLAVMEKDESLTIGVIMEASAQMRRFSLGIMEMESYLAYNKEILMGESQNDLFQLYFDLAMQMSAKKYSHEIVDEKLQLIAKFAEKLEIYNGRMIARRLQAYTDYCEGAQVAEAESVGRKEMDIMATDCLGHILEYAGYGDEEVDKISRQLETYQNLPDRLSLDKEVYSLRRALTAMFYDTYLRVFLRAMKEEQSITPVLEMFLNFGFMDVAFVGEEYAKELYDLTAHLDICQSNHIYTIYSWLKSIYEGRKEPSKNEFDMNYAVYLAEQGRSGKLSPEQVKEYYQDPEKRVEYEIRNMFTSVNKLTYGKITTFCPILNRDDLINSIDKMLVTAEKLETCLNEIRKVDFSVFYREVSFSDPEKGINNERIMKEILPDIILMPNAGTRVMMWQEVSGNKSNTPGRFMFPIFTAVDLDEMMLEVVGQFRWEMCRRIEGVHWNDIREKSLTAEYCTYIQFYRKNHELSVEAKEKIKSALIRGKNNYREVFVRDYVNWIKFESKGSFRLNKVSRDILIRYCPFVKAIRDDLRANPLYQSSLTRFETEMAKKVQRFGGVYSKYTKAGGVITEDLKNNLLYYQM